MDGELRVSTGTFLAAGAEMLDPNFQRSVVLVCHHDDQSAYGLVVNRQSGTTRSMLAEHPQLGKLEFPVFQGGPVELREPQILHRVPAEIPGGLQIADDVWVGGSFEAAAHYVARTAGDESGMLEAVRRVRLLHGYAGWSPGQLEHELRAGVWLPAVASGEVIFDDDVDSVWRKVVRSLGGMVQGMENEPTDPSWN